jgi:hypothetical protein
MWRHFRWLMTIVVTIGAVSGLPLPAVAAETAEGTTISGEIITTDKAWTADASPYYIDGPVQVAAGALLTIEAGARVYVKSTLQLEGGLTVAGTATNPVVVHTSVPLFRGIGAYSEPSRVVTISHADITGPGPLTGSDTKYLAFTLTDSRISDIPTTNYIWYPSMLLIERNVFTRVNTLEVGTSGSAVIRNNRFRGMPASGSFSGYNGSSQLVSWAAYGGPMEVTGNVFEASRLLEVSIDGRMDASGNYFGSTDPVEVKNWVTDKDDDLSRPGVVDVDPLLAAPPAEVPVAEPTAPRAISGQSDDQSVVVSWQPALSDGGSPVTGYTVTSSPGGHTKTVTADTTSTTVTGLTNGTGYTFTVVATNEVGDSAPSTPSNQVTPADTTDPVVRLSFTPTTITNQPSAEFRFTASDDDRVVQVECQLDGQAYSACSSPTRFDDLADGVHTLSVRVTDPAGNWTQASHRWTVDTTAPMATTTAPTDRSFTLRARVPVITQATDAGSGVTTQDVRWRRIEPNGRTSAWQYPSSWQNTTSTRRPSPGLADGFTYCFSTRARDAAGNASRWSAARCIAKPLDDRALWSSAGWSRGVGAKFYNKTHTSSTKRQVILRKTGLRATELGVVATKCPKCGTIGVYDDGRLIRRLNLYAPTLRHKQFIGLPRTAKPRTGTFMIKTLTNRKVVRIDGFAIHQR